MSEIKIFILEDNKEQKKLYCDAIAEFCKVEKVTIIPEFSDNLEDALEKIKKGDFDAAIIDLKLGGTDTDGEGNKIIREIRQNLRFPVFVMTGFLDELDADLREENVFYKAYRNTDKDALELLKEIKELYDTGITNILGKKGKIENILHEIFWKHIAVDISYWKSEIKDPVECEKTILRHIAAYLSAYLEMDEAGEFLCYNPAEVYIIPPIRKYVFTCDIVKRKADSKLFIVLTPACDLAQRKAKEITLVEIEAILMECVLQQKRILLKPLPAGLNDEEKQKYAERHEEAKENLERFLTNNFSFKYHFLPPTAQFPGGFVNFQKNISLKKQVIDSDFERVASITDKFAKDIIARFSHYYARQGQPELNVGELIKKILSSS